MNISIVIFLLITLAGSFTFSQTKNDDVLFWWKFDDIKKIQDNSNERKYKIPTIEESIKGGRYLAKGLGKYVLGVKGSAFKFDGFSSYIEGFPEIGSEENDDEFEFPKEISVEAWISLGAYPWNWAPILTIGKYKITGFYLGVDSRGSVGFHMSDATSVWHECNSQLNPDTKLGMELKKWYHVVGTYSPEEGLAIYVNGQLQNTYNDFTFDYGIVYSEISKGFRMGMNREPLPPTDPIRDWATYPSQYSIDGIVDELKVYGRKLTPDEILKNYNSIKPENEPQFTPRKFPTVKSSGMFSANYTRLKYYPEWDNIWPVGDFMDVVVQFDELPVKIMFWRGTRYSPCLVTENGKWMADQSRETGNNWFLSKGDRKDMPTGCIEHMSDTQTRSSRVSIIENNDARKVINWRYLQMDVQFRQKDLPNNTQFGEWGNELYYIYPDGVVVRNVLPGRGGWQETILLDEPGTRPEDNVELEAATLLNMKGESKTYSWASGYPVYDLDDANIQIVNLKSEYKPYIIFRDGGEWEVFNLEVRPEYSHFPWWNHWPVAQISSDGRSAYATDRAAHSSLSWGDPNGDAALYGMTNKNPKDLIMLAKSWNFPPTLRVNGSSIVAEDYEYTQRAYICTTETKKSNLAFSLEANEESPIYNPAFLFRNWEPENIGLTINEKEILRGKDFRYSTEYDISGNPTTIVWIKLKSTEQVDIKLTNN